jgi:hypothetical protein
MTKMANLMTPGAVKKQFMLTPFAWQLLHTATWFILLGLQDRPPQSCGWNKWIKLRKRQTVVSFEKIPDKKTHVICVKLLQSQLAIFRPIWSFESVFWAWERSILKVNKFKLSIRFFPEMQKIRIGGPINKEVKKHVALWGKTNIFCLKIQTVYEQLLANLCRIEKNIFVSWNLDKYIISVKIYLSKLKGMVLAQMSGRIFALKTY